METAVTLQVNQANLVKSLQFSFTNQDTCLGEMIQNARRAGASHVAFDYQADTQTLTVTDDGCGIASVSTLLTVAESGWDLDVMANENPFGIGFMSALFACQHLTVASKSGSFSAATADILAFQPIAVSPCRQWDGSTRITLAEIRLDATSIERRLKALAKGFPIEVSFNGEALARPHALDSGLAFAGSAVGQIHWAGLDGPSGKCDEFTVYLQGLPIYQSYQQGSNQHIVHLDSSRFHARLPDRDKLINEDEAVQAIKTALKEGIRQGLLQLKAQLSATAFVLFYPMLRHWGLLPMLNDVDALPLPVVREFDGYPVCDSDCHGHFLSRPYGSVEGVVAKFLRLSAVVWQSLHAVLGR